MASAATERPVPAEGKSYMQQVRETCQALGPTEHAWLDPEGAAAFASSLDVTAVKAYGNSLAATAGPTDFGLTYTSPKVEAGLITVAHALDFGSGFRQELHAATGRGAWNTIKPGVIALYNDCPELSAEYLRSLTEDKVATLFQLPYSHSQQQQAQKKGDDGAGLDLLVSHLATCCREMGEVLTQRGVASVPDFVFQAVEAEPTANSVVRALVTAFPKTFNDAYWYGGSHGGDRKPVFLFKKAQLVAGELWHRFRAELPKLFAFPDGSELTAYVDNVIVATMRKTGAIKTSDELTQLIESHVALASGSPEEVSLRAASLCAVELIVQKQPILDAATMGNYLWGALGKQPDFRKYERHAMKDAAFY